MKEYPFDVQALLAAAINVRQHSYSPYSKFKVGAALLTDTNEVFVGTNVENASFGLTCCAERTAVGAAVSAGHTRFLAIAIAATPLCPPCGTCRQFLVEFCEDLPIFMIDPEKPGEIIERQLAVLFPDRFQLPN